MLQRLEVIIAFYKPFFYWSFAINILLVMINAHIIPIVITKLIFTLVLWFFMNETNAKKKLIFYKNLGISNFKLFSTLFLIDIFFTIPFILLLDVFI